MVGVIIWDQGIRSFRDNVLGVLEELREEGYLEGPNMGLQAARATVTDELAELLKEAVTHLQEEGVEALFLPTDPVPAAPSNLEGICAHLVRARLPLTAPFESSVLSGSLLSYHADFAEGGRQAGRILFGVLLRDATPEIPKVKPLTLNLRGGPVLETSRVQAPPHPGPGPLLKVFAGRRGRLPVFEDAVSGARDWRRWCPDVA